MIKYQTNFKYKEILNTFICVRYNLKTINLLDYLLNIFLFLSNVYELRETGFGCRSFAYNFLNKLKRKFMKYGNLPLIVVILIIIFLIN